MNAQLLGGLTPERFLAEYWHKKPLLIRQAIPGFKGVIDLDDLFDLACDEDVESRYIREHDGQWEVRSGPQEEHLLEDRSHPWTVLVQGLELWQREADELLHRFDFIPQARLDDIMVSYATDGGGIGAHVDSYDVFLLQGSGQRRWRISAQTDLRLHDDVPLKLLADFRPEEEWVLEPGDMLYLPPHIAHEGIAIGECTTYSIGFRAPTANELASEFLFWMQERLDLPGRYADPDLTVQPNSAHIAPAMVDQVADMLTRIRWSREDVSAFLGHHLSEPRPNVFFDAPDALLSAEAFASQINEHGFILDPGTRLLSVDDTFFLNGTALAVAPEDRAEVAAFAHARRLPAGTLPGAGLTALLYEVYRHGLGYPDHEED